MAKVIEAKAVISAADKTGNVFDKIASKMKGVEKAAKSFEGVKAPRFAGDLYEELKRLNLSEKELNGVRKSFAALDQQLRQAPIGASHYIRAMEEAKSKTVSHWREIKASVDDAHESHKKFFKSAGHMARHTAAHVIGGVGGAYFAGHAIKEVIKGAAERNRAGIKYEQMGLTGDQLAEGNDIADNISKKFPSISRTEVLDDLRKNASRLGSWDRAKEIAEVYARAKISNKLSGGDDHELEQVVRAAEGAGAANTPGQFSSFLNAFSRAKAANPDYGGEEFSKDFRAAGAAKYGLGKDYMENVFPILASHTSGFGVKLATSNSALIGGRMTKQSKAALKEAGLLDENGHLIDEKAYQANPFDWTQSHVRPLLEAKGVKFGEDMSEEDKRTTSAWATKSFSAKNAADQIITNLLDAPLVEKARNRKTKGLEDMDTLQTKDVGLVWEGFTNQVKDAGTALLGLKSVSNQLSEETSRLANFDHFLRTGETPNKPNPLITALGLNDYGEMSVNDKNRIESLKAQSREIDQKYGWGLDDKTTQDLRLKQFDLQAGIEATQNAATMPPIFSDAEKERWQKMAPAGIEATQNAVPMPMSDPRKAGMPAVQSLEGATVQATLSGSADVHGEAALTVKVEQSSFFTALVERAENAIKLVGSLTTNGPGSTGKSSPDAAAPARPSTGSPFSGY